MTLHFCDDDTPLSEIDWTFCDDDEPHSLAGDLATYDAPYPKPTLSISLRPVEEEYEGEVIASDDTVAKWGYAFSEWSVSVLYVWARIQYIRR